MYTGEIISLGVACSWTITALCFEYAGKRIGTLSLNILRLLLAIVMLGLTMVYFTGHFIPVDMGAKAWFWLAVSGFIGYVLGDYCLFNSYMIIGSRFGQLFMTLAPPSAAIAGYFVLGEKLGLTAWLGMAVTLFGISLSIVGKPDGSRRRLNLKLPLKGVLLGVGAGVGQGIGLVFSKLGMDHYMQDIDLANQTAVQLVPFASTQVRAIVGVIGFLAMMMWTKQGKALITALTNKRGMAFTTAGTIFGPFLGVSFSLMAVQYTEAGIASTLMALTPIIILLPAWLFFKQKITTREVIGAIISVLGVALFFV